MLIAQISDTHISPPGQLTCSVAPMADALERIVDYLVQMRPKVDLVLLSGDVTQNGTAEEARHAADILSDLTMPLRIVPGNHDTRAALAGAFGDAVCPVARHGFMDHVFDVDPFRVIAVDTLDPGKPGGRIDPAQIDWIRRQCADQPSRPTLLMMHHPPLRLGVPETDEDGFEGAEALGELVADHPNILRVLCGHVHLHTTAQWCGTVVTTAPSTGMQLTLDLSQQAPSRFWLSEPAFLLHHWTAGEQLITHPIQLSEKQGPFDF